ncbi:MAG: DNRLRE domain-containing protein [Verrucomicrobiales bacterium]
MKMTRTLLLLISLSQAASAATTITAEADTYLWQGNGDTNYGSSATLGSTNDGGSAQSKTKDQIALIRFNISSLTHPVSGASLDLEYLSSEAYSFEVYGINDGTGDEAFIESTLTFNSSDTGTTSTEGSINSTNLTLLGNFDVTGAGAVNFSSAGLDSFLNADSNDLATFVIYRTSQSGSYTSFASREHATAAASTLSVIPEPSSLITLLSAGSLLSLRRRRAC